MLESINMGNLPGLEDEEPVQESGMRGRGGRGGGGGGRDGGRGSRPM